MNAITIGLDIAKSVFQVRGQDGQGRIVFQKRLKRSQAEAFFAKLPPARIGIEACGSAHHWGRTLRALGHEVRLIPASYVKAFVKREPRTMPATRRRFAPRLRAWTWALSPSIASRNRPRAGLNGRAICWSSNTPSL